MRHKNVAGFFAFFLGMFGTHWFYLGINWAGILQAALFGSFIFLVNVAGGGGAEDLFAILLAATIVAPILTGILWWATPQESWLKRYGKHFAYDATTQPRYLGADASATEGFRGHARPAILSGSNPTHFKAEGIRYYRTGDYDLALEAFQDAVAADATDAGAHFNLAATHAQLGRYPDALHHLELSVTHGLPGPERIERHPGLKKLRATPAFTAFRDNNYRVYNHVIELPETNVPPATNAAPGPQRTTPPPRAGRNEAPARSATPPPRRAETELPPLANEPAASASPAEGDLLEQIARLRELHDAGVLTGEEFRVQRERLLG